MSTEQKAGSAGAGSSADDLIKGGPSANDAGGELQKKDDIETIPKSQYEELETKLGQQGKELGDFRNFYKEISPLLDKLQTQPEVVEAILEGKIDSKLAQAVTEGKVKIEDATTVAEAQEKVKKEVGEKKYDNMSASEIEKLIKEKAEEIVSEKFKHLEKKVDTREESRDYEEGVNKFVKNTPDLEKYAEGIMEWLDAHPNQYDIEIAYNAVKGKVLAETLAEKEEEKMAEEKKRLALNAGGGQSKGSKIPSDSPLIDDLISSRSNPNIL